MGKQKRDAEKTKAKILLESRLLFSKMGYDATTVDDIARESGFNKALIYYYFNNKSTLYATIMSNLFEEMYEEITKKEKRCQGAKGKLRAFIATYATYAKKHPYFPALLLRELSDSGAHLPEMMFSSMRQLFMLLSEILAEGEKEGVFTKTMPMALHFMIIGTLNLFMTTEPLRLQADTTTEIDTCSECPIEEVSEYIFETITQGVTKK